MDYIEFSNSERVLNTGQPKMKIVFSVQRGYSRINLLLSSVFVRSCAVILVHSSDLGGRLERVGATHLDHGLLAPGLPPSASHPLMGRDSVLFPQ